MARLEHGKSVSEVKTENVIANWRKNEKTGKRSRGRNTKLFKPWRQEDGKPPET